jgi:hypothetical protein
MLKILGYIWFWITDLGQDFHGEAIRGPHYSRLKQALVSDGPAGRGKLHLRIWTYKVWYWFGLVNYTFTREFMNRRLCECLLMKRSIYIDV